MKALTLRPTWAWLVANGHKDIENRSWRTRMRGRIWIHAGTKGVTKAEYEDFLACCRQHRIRSCPDRDSFRTGGIVGSVEVIDCVTKSRSFWFEGPIGWVLANPRRTRFKPCKGKLGLFNPDI